MGEFAVTKSAGTISHPCSYDHHPRRLGTMVSGGCGDGVGGPAGVGAAGS